MIQLLHPDPGLCATIRSPASIGDARSNATSASVPQSHRTTARPKYVPLLLRVVRSATQPTAERHGAVQLNVDRGLEPVAALGSHTQLSRLSRPPTVVLRNQFVSYHSVKPRRDILGHFTRLHAAHELQKCLLHHVGRQIVRPLPRKENRASVWRRRSRPVLCATGVYPSGAFPSSADPLWQPSWLFTGVLHLSRPSRPSDFPGNFPCKLDSWNSAHLIPSHFVRLTTRSRSRSRRTLS